MIRTREEGYYNSTKKYVITEKKVYNPWVCLTLILFVVGVLMVSTILVSACTVYYDGYQTFEAKERAIGSTEDIDTFVTELAEYNSTIQNHFVPRDNKNLWFEDYKMSAEYYMHWLDGILLRAKDLQADYHNRSGSIDDIKDIWRGRLHNIQEDFEEHTCAQRGWSHATEIWAVKNHRALHTANVISWAFGWFLVVIFGLLTVATIGGLYSWEYISREEITKGTI